MFRVGKDRNLQVKKWVEVVARKGKNAKKRLVTCDLCGEEISQDWTVFRGAEMIYTHTQPLAKKKGTQSQQVITDVCGECYNKKLWPWLSEQGVKMNLESWSIKDED